MTISHIPTWQLREAANAWRSADYARSFLFGRKPINTSLHDKIDDLIGEVERLRNIKTVEPQP